MLSDMDELPFIKMGDEILRFELDPLSPSGKEVALRELRETPENKEYALGELRRLLQGKILLTRKCTFLQKKYEKYKPHNS